MQFIFELNKKKKSLANHIIKYYNIKMSLNKIKTNKTHKKSIKLIFQHFRLRHQAETLIRVHVHFLMKNLSRNQ